MNFAKIEVMSVNTDEDRYIQTIRNWKPYRSIYICESLKKALGHKEGYTTTHILKRKCKT